MDTDEMSRCLGGERERREGGRRRRRMLMLRGETNDIIKEREMEKMLKEKK